MSSSPPADPGHLRDGANRFKAAASHLQTTHDTLANATDQLAQGGAWLGDGSQSFADAWRRFGADTRGAVDALQKTATVLNKFADAIEQQQQSQAWSIVTGIGLGLLTVVEVAADAAQGGADVATDAATVVTADAAASAFAAVGEGFAAAEDAAIAGLDAVADSAVDVGDIAGDVSDVAADVPDDPFSGDPTTTDPTTDGGPGDQPLGGRGPSPDDGQFGARGQYSGRDFNPDEAGGPISDPPMTTDGVQITDEGIQQVEQHLSRFGDDPANEAMINRLKQIASGNLEPTQADLNFYTHELDEFGRYKSLGWETGVPEDPDAAAELWNNTHTAALEDYGLRDWQPGPDGGRIYLLYDESVWDLFL